MPEATISQPTATNSIGTVSYATISHPLHIHDLTTQFILLITKSHLHLTGMA
jgi:hypothetical protein